jgi:small subunit ribosomal protein S10
MVEKKKVKEEPQPRLRIRLRAYDYKVLDKSVQQIVDTAFRYGVKVAGPIPLPTEIHRYSVKRSPFIHEESHEQFEMRIHKRLIDVLNPTSKLIEALRNINLPAGVRIEIKM